MESCSAKVPYRTRVWVISVILFLDPSFLPAGNTPVVVDGLPLIQSGAGAPFAHLLPRPQVIDQNAALGRPQSFF